MQGIKPYAKKDRVEEEVKKVNPVLSVLLCTHIHGTVLPFYFPNSLKQQKECSSLLQVF